MGSGYGAPMTTVNANGVALGIESFGDDDAPLVLLAGGTTMHSWPDALCKRFAAAGGRRVVRYDPRTSRGPAPAGRWPRWPRSTIRGAFSAHHAHQPCSRSAGGADRMRVGVAR
jgi:hypothetical protein